MAARDDLPGPVRRYFDLCNEDRVDELSELWAPDVEHTAFGRDGRRTRRGPDEVAGYYAGLFSPWSEHHDEVVHAATDGARTTAEIRFTGRTHEGADVAFDALDVVDLAPDGRIRRLAIWHDVLHTRAVLGL